MGNFSGKFSYTFSKIILGSTYEQLLTWICYCVSNLKQVLTGYFLAFFYLVPPFFFLKWNRFFSTFIPVLLESRHYFKYLLSREVCTNLKKLKISANETLIHNLNVRGLWIPKYQYQKAPPHVSSFWNCLSRNFLIIRLIIITLL